MIKNRSIYKQGTFENDEFIEKNDKKQEKTNQTSIY